jgi:hypothetical protein
LLLPFTHLPLKAERDIAARGNGMIAPNTPTNSATYTLNQPLPEAVKIGPHCWERYQPRDLESSAAISAAHAHGNSPFKLTHLLAARLTDALLLQQVQKQP